MNWRYFLLRIILVVYVVEATQLENLLEKVCPRAKVKRLTEQLKVEQGEILREVEFWRRKYKQINKEHRKLTAKYEKLTTDHESLTTDFIALKKQSWSISGSPQSQQTAMHILGYVYVVTDYAWRYTDVPRNLLTALQNAISIMPQLLQDDELDDTTVGSGLFSTTKKRLATAEKMTHIALSFVSRIFPEDHKQLLYTYYTGMIAASMTKLGWREVEKLRMRENGGNGANADSPGTKIEPESVRIGGHQQIAGHPSPDQVSGNRLEPSIDLGKKSNGPLQKVKQALTVANSRISYSKAFRHKVGELLQNEAEWAAAGVQDLADGNKGMHDLISVDHVKESLSALLSRKFSDFWPEDTWEYFQRVRDNVEIDRNDTLSYRMQAYLLSSKAVLHAVETVLPEMIDQNTQSEILKNFRSKLLATAPFSDLAQSLVRGNLTDEAEWGNRVMSGGKAEDSNFGYMLKSTSSALLELKRYNMWDAEELQLITDLAYATDQELLKQHTAYARLLRLLLRAARYATIKVPGSPDSADGKAIRAVQTFIDWLENPNNA